MAAFTLVIRSHRRFQAHLGNDDNHSEGYVPPEGPPAGLDRPLAAERPLGLPASSPALQERLWRDRQYRRDRSLVRRRERKRLAASPFHVRHTGVDRITSLVGATQAKRPDLQSSGADPSVGFAGTIVERRAAVGQRKIIRLPASALRAAFPPEKFGLGADCTDAALSSAVDQSWMAARGFQLSGAPGLPGRVDDCSDPQRITVAIPEALTPENVVRFWRAFEEAAFQLPQKHTQAHLDACADEAWHELFGHRGSLTVREQVWASVPTWCWVDEPFCNAFGPLFDALPDMCTSAQLAAALEEAWDETHPDQG